MQNVNKFGSQWEAHDMKRKTHAERLAQSKADKLRREAELPYEWVFTDNTVDFEKRAAEMGIKKGDQLGVYDSIACYDFQDAVIALRMMYLDTPTEYEVCCVATLYNATEDKAQQVPVTFYIPEMPFTEMREGSQVKVDRGNGIKTRWKGLDDEVADVVNAENLTDEWELYRVDFQVKFVAKFRDAKTMLGYQHLINLRNKSIPLLEQFLKAE